MVDATKEPALSDRSSRYLRIVLMLSIVLVLNYLGIWMAQQFNFQLFPRHDPMLQTVILSAVIVYILLMATPFMPGIEIGLALMLLLGAKGALLVYLCTLAALSISFTVGRVMPSGLVSRFLHWLHLQRAGELVRQLEPLDQLGRLQLLNEKTPSRIAPFLLKHRYLAIAAALNLPGNALIGGGGGIALVVGMSKIIPYPGFILLLAVVVAPVPLWFYLQG